MQTWERLGAWGEVRYGRPHGPYITPGFAKHGTTEMAGAANLTGSYL